MDKTIIHIVGWGLTAAISVIGFFMTNNKETIAQINDIKQRNAAAVERVAVVETSTNALKEDVKEIKGDVKLILSRLK